jgi:hypothetical protein
MRVLIVAIVAVLGLAVVWKVASRTSLAVPIASSVAAPAASDHPRAEPPAAVGWVFGRVMGFPGADRPLMSGSYPAMPPTARSASAFDGQQQ